MSNKLSQFWQELKRRKVLRLLTIYAGTAFVILEASSIIFPRWGFPDWTIDVVIYLIVLGAIITFVVSWIYDFTPEGVRKTLPVSVTSEGEAPPTPNGWKIASYISIVVIVALIVLNIIPRTNRLKEIAILEKSIAVLPFTSLSDDPEKQYLADGVMDAILLHLSKIEDLRVMSRTSVEQYRVTEKKATEICEELDVGFILEGSFRQYGDQARLIVQLIQSGKEDHVWANQYDREWTDIFAVESEVAQIVASELQVAITPEEKESIEKIPTTSLTAYDFYQRGTEERWNYSLHQDRDAPQRAEVFFRKALEYDSTYAKAYSGLADVYLIRNELEDYFISEEILDSANIIIDMALSYNNKLSEGYVLKANIFGIQGKIELAIIEFDKAIQYSPNNWYAYNQRALLYGNNDYVKVLSDSYKAASLNRGPLLPFLLRNIAVAYMYCGFLEKATTYSLEAFHLDGDSGIYIENLAYMACISGNYDEGIMYYKQALSKVSTDSHRLSALGTFNLYRKHYEESLKYFKEYIRCLPESWSGSGATNKMHRFGYVYLKNGIKDTADYYFDQQIQNCKLAIELNRYYASEYYAYYDLAAIYTVRGEREKAYENLRIFNRRKIFGLYMVTKIKNDPMFDSIRHEPEFQQIVRDVEAKYQAEHERVRKWLEENDML